MFRGHLDMKMAIQRELEKERIRGEILAKEMACRSVLEAEVWMEMMMEREWMAVRNGQGTFKPLPLPPNHNNLFELRMLQHKVIGLEERIAMMSLEKHGVGGHGCDIGGFGAVPFQQFGESSKMKGIPTTFSEDNKKKVIDLGKPKVQPVAAGSSEPHSDGSKKKLKEEWSCSICRVTATTERIFNEHLQGKKHQAKEAALIAKRTGANIGFGVTPKKPICKPVKPALTTVDLNPSDQNSTTKKKSVKNSSKTESNDSKKENEFKFWCEMCEVGTLCEKAMNDHKQGKKHSRRKAMAVVLGEVKSMQDFTGGEEECEVKTVNEAVKNQVTSNTPLVAAGSSKTCLDCSEKKATDEWSCAICQVTATTERIFIEHLQGKKHRANIGLGVTFEKPIMTLIKPALTTVDPNPSDQNSKAKKKSVKNSSKTDSNDSKKELKRDEFMFTCEVGTLCEKMMNDHKEGKKLSRRKAKAVAPGEVKSGQDFNGGEEEAEVKNVNGTVKNQGKPNAPLVTAGSTEPCSDGSKKKLKEEWSCVICQVSVTSERIFNQHLQGKKHRAKEAALIAEKTLNKPIMKSVKL